MPSVCFYFQVHQPYRLRHYHLFEIGKNHDYFDHKANREICRKVAKKCYLPANALMLELIQRYPKDFKISYSISGVALEQFAEYCPEVVESFQKLVATGNVELLDETYYHSLSSLFNGEEFRRQVKLHRQQTKDFFGVKPAIFRNTELIYSNGIADMVEAMGYKAMLAEGWEPVLKGKSPNFVYEPKDGKGMKLLLKNYKLSDDIAFRFSNREWTEWPLSSDTFSQWLHRIDGSGDTVNLFMDYETMGEHQWEDTGIFEFFRALPETVMRHPGFSFATPSEVIVKYPPVAKISVPNATSWADLERDTSAWLGNPMQDGAIAWLYTFEQAVLGSKDRGLIHTWRKLQTSDHFYYMCTKFWADGDVHKYFSVYDAPHDSYTIMSNVLTDMELRTKRVTPARPVPIKKKASKAATQPLRAKTLHPTTSA
ncbi:MAG: glycoside hydrolase family 57 protein [bacterium]